MIVSHHRARHPRRRFVRTERAQRDDGYIMVKFALLIVPLMLMTGFAVDVGFWYNRAADVQKAADAAALAGVVWLPNEAKADEAARAAARQNGYVQGVNGIDIDVEPAGERRLRVTIDDPRVGSFFYGNLGGGDINIERTALAEYVLPVKMGSPERFLGNDPTASGYPTGAPNLWASISGPNSNYSDGDPYSTKRTPGGASTGNPEYRTWGYIYVVDVPQSAVGQTLDVEIYDAGHYPRSNYPNVETADNGSVNTQFELFRPDPTPLNPHDGLDATYSLSGQCQSGTPGRFRIANDTSSSTYRNRWATLCRLTVSTPGQYLMQVKSSNIPTITDGGAGWNQFSVRTSLSGSVQPRLYTVGDLSMFNNLPGRSGDINATFHLAEVDDIHAGKTLVVSLFDPGDGQSGTYYANIKGPGGSTMSCRYRTRGTSTWTSSSSCRIQTRANGSNVYNGKWLDIQVQIPNGYSCTDCWWKVLYEFQDVQSGRSPNDRTVWSAEVIGDPVHLLEEEAP